MLYEYIRLARKSISAARFRSFLTMAGIIIGVVSVVTTASLGEGIKHQISGQANSAGKDLITIRPGKLVNRDDNGKVSGINLLSLLTSSTITEKDFETIKKDPNIQTAVPFSVLNGVPSKGKENFNEGFVMATNEKMPSVIIHKVEFGNFFGEDEGNKRTAVIGQQVAEKLFKENVPVSKTLQISGQDFVVSAVLEKVPPNPLNPQADFNNGVFIPLQTGRDITGGDLKIYEVLARPKTSGPAKVDQAISSLNNKLKENHGQREDFTILRQEDVLSVADSVVSLVNKTVTVMAGITLLVGGIGIMNVMLVSVTERTREIGIRKAVGATNRQIHTQFLIEAAVLSAWGALIGILLSALINLMFRILTNFQPIITWEMVALSVLSSIAIGVIFGVIPAFKASKHDPIEALRAS